MNKNNCLVLQTDPELHIIKLKQKIPRYKCLDKVVQQMFKLGHVKTLSSFIVKCQYVKI